MIRLVLTVAIALTLVASPAIAGQITVGYPGSAYGQYQAGIGGEFTLATDGTLSLSGYTLATSNFGPNGITSFQTFCIEQTEYIYGNTTYNAAINTAAVNGSVGPGGDPLSVGTGWLYSQFAMGTLAGYNYNIGTTARKQSATLLQAAIWWLEGEASFNNTNIFMAAVVSTFGSQVAAQANGAAAYGVYALNLWQGGNPTQNRAQDQLYFAGLPATNVPDGSATLTLLGIGALVLLTLRKLLALPFRN